MSRCEPAVRSRQIAGIRALKAVAYRTGLHRWLFYRYEYMFSPSQLCLLVDGLTRTSGLSGSILELGCAAGHTTAFLNQHLATLGDTRPYVCVDTFEGFTGEDIAHEQGRGKEPSTYPHLFRAYRQEWFDQTMANNGFDDVVSIKADVNELDFSAFPEISFCLIDVDLQRPVVSCLEGVLPRMQAGGIVVVDDCGDDARFDGAYAGYAELTERYRLPSDIRAGKLGIIEIDEERRRTIADT